MSNTPRTDAACGWPWGHHGRIEYGDLMHWSPDGPFVHSCVARELERAARELERENAALRAAIAESEEFARKNGETLATKVRELLAENAALRAESKQLSDEVFSLSMEEAKLTQENAALRELLTEPYQFFRFGHKALTPWGKALDGWCERAENLGVGKEAQP